MPTFTEHSPGTPCWVDLMSPDPDAAKGFYHEVFGWDAEDDIDDDGNYLYTLFRKDGQIVAGMGGQPPGMEGAPPLWNSYVAVEDPEAVVEKVTAAGGQVLMPPMQVLDAGHMAILADPTGAAISIWKAGEHFGAEVCNEPDTWSWTELMTRDLEAALPFYQQVFGWSYETMDMGPMGSYHVIEGGENDGLGGLMAMPPDVPEMVPNHWGVYFTVADLDATLATLTESGGSIVNGPMDIPGIGRSATVHDPAGASFNLLEPADQA